MTDVTGASPFGLGCPSQLATGAFTSDGNDTSISVGYLPRHIILFNETDGVRWEKVHGMASANSFKTSGAGGSIDTTSAISFPTDPGLNEPGNTVLLSAALCGTGKKISWAVYG